MRYWTDRGTITTEFDVLTYSTTGNPFRFSLEKMSLSFIVISKQSAKIEIYFKYATSIALQFLTTNVLSVFISIPASRSQFCVVDIDIGTLLN